MSDNNSNNGGPQEEFKVSGEELLAKVKAIIKEGHARRIIIKTKKAKLSSKFPF